MEIITTSIADNYLDEEGILHVKLKEGANVDLKNLKENFEAYHRLVGDNYTVLLIDSRVSYVFTKEAREYAAGEAVPIKRAAVAFLVDSVTNKWIANLFITLHKPKVPTRMFTDREKALEWVRTFFVFPGKSPKKNR